MVTIIKLKPGTRLEGIDGALAAGLQMLTQLFQSMEITGGGGTLAFAD